MMYIQTRRRKMKYPFSSFRSNSFLLFSLHFPLNLNCQTNWKIKEATHSEDLNSGVSSSASPPHGGDYEGGDEQRKGNDCEVFLSTPQYNSLETERKGPTHLEDSVHGASSSSTSPRDHGDRIKRSKGNGIEVFLSFRGIDTRRSFVDYLYTSLIDAGISVFQDKEEFSVGEEVDGSDLLYAIKQAKILIPIISKNYASSKFCLCELTQMLECKELGHIVLPIYYDVKPSEVRYLKGSFGEAFHEHRKNWDEMNVAIWMKALREITHLSGWEANGYQGALVKSVVELVMSNLNGTKKITSFIDDYEVGTKKSKGNEYEVFLSFRGSDTRKGFTDYLYTILVDSGINVFMEDDDLRDGKQIDQKLFVSISQCKISIPIISENYAFSQWCLRDLALMLNCKRSRGQKVFPILYKVKPRDLRYEDDIYKWKENLGVEVAEEWKEALREVRFFRAWESEKEGYEGAFVKMIVERVRSELNRPFQQIVPKELMGIDERVEQIMSLIDAKFNDTRIVGIWGNEGIGKTTLARVLYNKLSSHFRHISVVANIRETSLHKGIECLQKQLIDDILRSPIDLSIDKINVIKSRFIDKKVLILLDDMDTITDFNTLVGDVSWFKTGSIVIITTRNKSILDKIKVGIPYELSKLSSDESKVLFSRYAFRNDYPDKAHEIISHNVISIIRRFPLALKVIGAFLRGKRRGVWNDTLKKLMNVPHQKVQETLMISYEELDDREKQIFLDIACFLIGSSRQISTYMWDACGFLPKDGIEVLSHMSLIKIDKDGNLMMHNQLRDLGREIVNQENLEEPQARSRLWNYEEVVRVLDSNKDIIEDYDENTLFLVTSMQQQSCKKEKKRKTNSKFEKTL